MLTRSLCLVVLLFVGYGSVDGNEIRELQAKSVASGKPSAVRWGIDAQRYSSWTTHSNRLIPVYTYGTKGAGKGIDLADYTGENSVYHDAERIRRLYQTAADRSVDPSAEYMDQTNLFDLQRAALDAGRKYIFLVVFDGMDWQTTRAASIYNQQRIAYTQGRGTGTHFQDYQAGGTSQYGWMVTSPFRDGAQVDVDTQRVNNPGSGLPGGYNAEIAGLFPWSESTVPEYLIAGPGQALVRHAFTDSAASATSMCCGIKSFNGAIGVTGDGRARPSIAHLAQAAGYRIGLVTSVPISHATPAAAYAHNVSRNDYQDLTRDLLGLASVSHPAKPFTGVDVLLGAGHGVDDSRGKGQGENFVVGNKYITDQDLRSIDVQRGGKYLVVQRTAGKSGEATLAEAATRAAQQGTRLFGFYGVNGQSGYDQGHLPYASADGAYDPAPGQDGTPMQYSEADLFENPTLSEMTEAAITVLSAGDKPFWVMVEPGDVDWANHDNNIDTSIGAVNSGDAAVRRITDWVEAHSNWQESLLVVTADHGHYLVIERPELLIRGKQSEE